MSEVNLYQEAGRGAQAKAWLDNPMTVEAFGKVRQEILDKWANSPIEDREGQHELRLILKALDTVKQYVTDIAMTGEIAKAQLSAIEQMKKSGAEFLNKFGVRV